WRITAKQAKDAKTAGNLQEVIPILFIGLPTAKFPLPSAHFRHPCKSVSIRGLIRFRTWDFISFGPPNASFNQRFMTDGHPPDSPPDGPHAPHAPLLAPSGKH